MREMRGDVEVRWRRPPSPAFGGYSPHGWGEILLALCLVLVASRAQARELWLERCQQGFWDLSALVAALDLELPAALDEPRTADELAEAAAVPEPRRLRALLCG